MTKIEWHKLTSLAQIDELDQRSDQQPVVIFKHSTRCSVSAMALDRLERKWNKDNHPEVSAYYLDVIAHRDVSMAVAERYGVTHESPQILVIDKGSCIYDNSHMGISYDDVLVNLTPAAI